METEQLLQHAVQVVNRLSTALPTFSLTSPSPPGSTAMALKPQINDQITEIGALYKDRKPLEDISNSVGIKLELCNAG